MGFLLDQANQAVFVWWRELFIRVLCLGGGADVGLEVCRRQYILL